MKLRIIALLGMFAVQSADACSIAVNDLYQKNLLVGLAAAEMNVDLAKATSIAVASYSKDVSGGSSGSSCPDYLNTHARVTVHYKPNKFTACSFSVTIHRAQQIGEPLVPGPFESVTTALPVSSCALIGPIVRPFGS